jgi:hypothetical protein
LSLTVCRCPVWTRDSVVGAHRQQQKASEQNDRNNDVSFHKDFSGIAPPFPPLTDIHRMTALLRRRLSVSTDFSNTNTFAALLVGIFHRRVQLCGFLGVIRFILQDDAL